jgi:SAM-dependent methyltransferase
MNINFELSNLENLKKYMKDLSGGYQIYNPFTFPIEPEGLVLSKLNNLNYKTEDFFEKSVTDLGCCLGFFSFYTYSYLGASKVTGYDSNHKYLEWNKKVKDNNPEVYKNISFVHKDLTRLPEIEKNDIIMAHAIIHWLFIMNEKISLREVIQWLYDNCNYAVYLEGCIDANDPTMIKFSIDESRITKESFIEEASKVFSKVDLIGEMDYCKTRVILRLFK